MISDEKEVSDASCQVNETSYEDCILKASRAVLKSLEQLLFISTSKLTPGTPVRYYST